MGLEGPHYSVKLRPARPRLGSVKARRAMLVAVRQTIVHDRRMEPPPQPRLVARLALAARLELFLELGARVSAPKIFGEQCVKIGRWG